MEFYKYMNDGGVIVDIASSSAYEAPSFLVKHQIFEMAEFQEEKFLKHMVGESKMAPGDANDAGFARDSSYGTQKNVPMNMQRKGSVWSL